jgi:hypothetical protein
MPRKRGDDQHPRLGYSGILGKAQQLAERPVQGDLLAHRDFAVANRHAIDAKLRATMRQSALGHDGK